MTSVTMAGLEKTIRIYIRLRPLEPKQTGCQYETSKVTASSPDLTHRDTFQLSIPRQESAGFVNNTREQYSFRFDGVFEGPTKQSDVFDVVAKPIVDSALDGYNGTLFAYGQTGSGKTYTITGTTPTSGHPQTVAGWTKGIIPRTLSYIFSKLNAPKQGDNQNTEGEDNSVSISYFEIYNEVGYDLLQTRTNFDRLEDLPKLKLLEDGDQNIHLRNLSMHAVKNERDAMDLLAVGEANRVMAETPMNPTSTRSHCIFTIITNRRAAGSAIVRSSKLHIVDLAGSERVYKSGIAGRSLTEAMCINLALHHLEQVIIALADKTRSHVPYRNSLMTSILKDSLGGNSLTSMIATCSLEESNVGETISTCQFAQRVALIKNEVTRNEVLNPLVQIELLKKEIENLKSTCLLQHGGAEISGAALSEDETRSCHEIVDEFLADSDSAGELNIPLDWRKIQWSFRYLKQKVSACPSRETAEASEEAVQKLETAEKTLQQRDREIAILCKLLRKEKKRIDELLSTSLHQSETAQNPINRLAQEKETSKESSRVCNSPSITAHFTAAPSPQMTPLSAQTTPLSHDSQISDLRKALLAKFVQSHPQRCRIEELKNGLLERTNQARLLGADIRRVQSDIQSGSEKLSQLQTIDSFAGDTIKLFQELQYNKIKLQTMLEQLRALKEQVEYSEKLANEITRAMLVQFEQYWNETRSANLSPFTENA